MLIYSKFIIKFTVLTSVLLSCASLRQSAGTLDGFGSAFSKGQALVMAHDYQQALPYINRSLEEDTLNYKESLLLAARAYDQLSLPEEALLSIQEFLKPRKDILITPLKELTARSLRLKNQAKAKSDITQNEEKNAIQKLINDKNYSKKNVLDSLSWSLDFNCDKFCIDEILYFQEIQTTLLYIVEQDKESSAAASALIKSRYAFFHRFLKSDVFNLQYKKEIASKLYDCLQKLKNLDLVYTQKNKIYPSKILIASLDGLEKDLESWHYK
ncbi:MAG: hypothetical protein H7Z71_05935 [Moraxellaceae bacterium]|nr:hypothetical protein [Pseudobdellovibrionaceae bacterium]